MKLLHLDSSILGDHSVSRALSRAAVERLTSVHPDIEVTYHDLAAEPVAHLSGRYLAGQSDDVQHDQALQEDLALGGKVLEAFLEADIVVIGVALYNFGIASQLKSWVDRICVAGKTFRYTDAGPQGLAGDKRVILAIARGGLYGPGTPSQSFEHAETYMRSVLAFIGVTAPEVFVAEGLALGADKREAATEAALATIAALKAA
ncbi:FMN-dependent NADH-azoreductase [Rhizobium sp. Leaf341]|uniref:FMN-dependent NADH-azoreductase n=1 Tax=Rhizobium sp. Leaf341 TaxID=1736344 RepID=UPI000715BDF5|nr:NAD(P)H-dependent oxidoreductase [Rhizobium sp. Leaf341]KQR75908.1 FMN-dependent NADH-azoreductase [Rhizobium sp. Leaf341]